MTLTKTAPAPDTMEIWIEAMQADLRAAEIYLGLIEKHPFFIFGKNRLYARRANECLNGIRENLSRIRSLKPHA